MLRRASPIACGCRPQWRRCRLEAGPLKDVANWVARYRRFWEESLECLDQHLKEVQPVEKPEPKATLLTQPHEEIERTDLLRTAASNQHRKFKRNCHGYRAEDHTLSLV